MVYKIGIMEEITGVKAGTIRFYEKCGFLENVERLSNNYRIFNIHHIYQVKICRLIFGGFVNHNLRKASIKIIEAAKEWNLSEYEAATINYINLINNEISRTKETIDIITNNFEKEISDVYYTKKQAAYIIGVTEEAIRNWERNQLLPQFQPYQKRFYSKDTLKRMYVIRLLLNTGYSIMIIRKFIMCLDSDERSQAIKSLVNPDDNEDLMNIGDRYLHSLLDLRNKAKELYSFLYEMKKI